MPTIRFNSTKQVQDPPVALGESDELSFSLINTDSDLTEGGTSEISISLEKPIAIQEGDFQFSYDGVAAPFIPAKDCTPYNIGLALNSLSTIVSAGGVDVTGSMPFPLIKFNEAGSRETFVVTHSILGTLPYRAVTLTAGTVSVKATVEFDLSLQTLVKSATATDLTAPTLTVANISTGSVSAYQEDRITLSGKPEAGGFSIRTATDTITRLVPYSASAYEAKSALDAVASGAFTVRRAETGESIYWNIRRLAKGVNDAITVESQLESATGISMSLSLANVRELLSIVGAPAKVPVILSFRYNSVLQFAIPVDLTAPDPSGSVSFLTAPDAGSSSWGGITGALADQTDLQAALDAKMDLDSGLSTDGQVWTSDGLGSASWETLAIGTVPAANVSGLATVATTGAYSDLSGAPTVTAAAIGALAEDTVLNRTGAGDLSFLSANGSVIFRTAFSGARLYSPIPINADFFGFGATTDVSLARISAGACSINSGTISDYRDLFLRNLTASGPIVHASYTVATVPDEATYARGIIYVSDETGGATMAFSDGTNWRRFSDRAIVS
jgi:hypothetical protein